MNWRRKWINPVLNKEFLLRMRTPRSAFSVLIYVLVMGLLGMGIIYVMTSSGMSSNGRLDPGTSRLMFYALSIAQLVLIAFMTPALTAGVISGEREKQTLNMLLTTQQSSATIILSKLAASLSFMTLVILATLPVYSIVFIYGGVSPKQLIFVFLFYLFVMLLLGALGVLFSTIFKKTMLAVIMTYGVGLVIFVATGIGYIFAMGIVQVNFYSSNITPTSYSWVGYILGLNPAGALISIFEPSFSDSVFMIRGGGSGQTGAPIELWQQFIIVYSVVIVIALWLAIRYIRPVRGKKVRTIQEAGPIATMTKVDE